MNKNNVQKSVLPSEQVQEVMRNIPGGLIRWGITVVALIVLVLLIGAWFFKYPDIIKAEVTVNMEQSPAVLKARSTGKLVALLVTNQTLVEANTPLAVIENPADYNDMLWLDACLTNLQIDAEGVKTDRKSVV